LGTFTLIFAQLSKQKNFQKEECRFTVRNAKAIIRRTGRVRQTSLARRTCCSASGAIVGLLMIMEQDCSSTLKGVPNETGGADPVFATHHHVVGVAGDISYLTLRCGVVRHTEDGKKEEN
jgi:hypothetical protein